MPLPSSALRDFALSMHAPGVDPGRLARQLARLREDFPGELRAAEVYASTRTLEVVLLLRFARTESPSLARRMQSDAQRLGAQLNDLAALRDAERAALYERLGQCELRADVTEEADAAFAAFSERLGIGHERAPVLTWEAADRGELLRLYVRNAAHGLDAGAYRLDAGRPVRVRLVTRGEPPLELEGSAVSEGGETRVRARPSPELEWLVVLEASRLRAGRPSAAGGTSERRACHLLARRPGLAPEPILELGPEELLLLPARRIPEGAELSVAVEGPDATWLPFRLRLCASGEVAFGSVQAQRLQLLEADAPDRLNAALERLARRPPRLLALLGDAPLRHALDERLRGSGIELSMPDVAGLGEAIETGLLRADAVLIDLERMGGALPERLDTLARAADLRIVALGQKPAPTLRELPSVRDVVRKGEPLARLLRGIDRCLGR